VKHKKNINREGKVLRGEKLKSRGIYILYVTLRTRSGCGGAGRDLVDCDECDKIWKLLHGWKMAINDNVQRAIAFIS
jgi:hypothetical protein